MSVSGIQKLGPSHERNNILLFTLRITLGNSKTTINSFLEIKCRTDGRGYGYGPEHPKDKSLGNSISQVSSESQLGRENIRYESPLIEKSPSQLLNPILWSDGS